MASPDVPDQRRTAARIVVGRSPGRFRREGAFETFIKITADGSVTAFNGHVDLGTGIRTALGQIVAEELDVSFARVVVVLGDTSRVPNQGPTIASETIQITAVPLRKAAAQARHFLMARAAERLELPAEELPIEDGLIRGRDNRSVSYGELIAGETIRLELADDVRSRRSMPTPSSGSRCRASTCRRRRPANWSMCTMCACPACCTAASCARPMPASMPALLSAPA